MKSYRFADLVDVASLRKIAEANFRATGMPVGIIDAADGSIVVGVGWQDICTNFHRAHPAAALRCQESDACITKHLQKNTPCSYKCANGLWDIGTPIIVDEQHLATLFLGQFFYDDEVPDRAFFLQQAVEFGFDTDAYLAVLDRVPAFSRAKVQTIVDYDIGLAGFLAESAEKVLRSFRAEDALRKSEERYRRLHESMTDAFAMVDMTGHIVETNRAFEDMLGYRPEELQTLTYEDLTPAHWHADEAGIVAEQIIPRGWSDVYEKEYIRKDGTVFPVELRTFLLRDDEGQPSAMWAIVRDLTERHRADESVRASERKFQALFGAMSEMVALHELVRTADGQVVDYRIVDCNAAYTAITGISRERAIGALGSALYAGGGEPPYLAEYSNVALTGVPRRLETYYGAMQKHFVISVVSPAPDTFATVTADITDRKKSEEAVATSEEKFRTIFDSSPVGLILFDDKSTVLDCNQAFADIFGVSKERYIGLNLLESMDDPRQRSTIQELFQTGWTEFEGPYTSIMTGKHLQIAHKGIRIGPSLYLSIMEDITKRKDAEAEREALRQQLLQSQKMEAVGVLAGGVAHDFNNILQAIMSSANLIRLKFSGTETLQHIVDDILTLSERAADLTRGLLAFSRKQIIAPRPQDLNELVRMVAKLYSRLLGEDIDMQLELSADRIGVNVDSAQMQQVLLNLLTNARDAMPTGGTLTIMTAEDVRALPDGVGNPVEKSCAVLTIQDTGQGIEEKDIARIFEPFYTTKEVGKGTGLGLSVAYGIVQQHGGTITVTSRPGGGATFTVLLPGAAARTPQRQEAAERAERGAGETILLVEDDEQVRAATASILEAYGYTVLSAASGPEAIELHRQNMKTIRLALLDVIMPGMNGEKVYEVLSAQQPNLKVIFLSGYPKDVLEQRKLREVMYLSKPVNPGDLIRTIQAVLSS